MIKCCRSFWELMNNFFLMLTMKKKTILVAFILILFCSISGVHPENQTDSLDVPPYPTVTCLIDYSEDGIQQDGDIVRKAILQYFVENGFTNFFIPAKLFFGHRFLFTLYKSILTYILSRIKTKNLVFCKIF